MWRIPRAYHGILPYTFNFFNCHQVNLYKRFTALQHGKIDTALIVNTVLLTGDDNNQSHCYLLTSTSNVYCFGAALQCIICTVASFHEVATHYTVDVAVMVPANYFVECIL